MHVDLFIHVYIDIIINIKDKKKKKYTHVTIIKTNKIIKWITLFPNFE
jgi:hypothetical protein